MIGVAIDPTSHNLWPFEIVMGDERRRNGAAGGRPRARRRRAGCVMQQLGALFLIAMGAGVLAVGWRGYRVGELPTGSNFIRPFRPNRDDNPLAFRFFLALYYFGGADGLRKRSSRGQ